MTEGGVDHIALEPVDTWYFADGTPSSADSSGQWDVGGIFPPHPPTVVGALRAALARANGWSGSGRWPEDITQVLGDGYGADDLGRLSFDGPYLLRGGQPLYRAPVHLLGRVDTDGCAWQPREALRPGEPLACDLGQEVRLPVPPTGSDPALGQSYESWVDPDALAEALNGEVPQRPATTEWALWRQEQRVGIARDNVTRTAADGMLYTARHARLVGGVAIGMRVRGLPEDWQRPGVGTLLPFGGEGRMARVASWDGHPGPLAVPPVGHSGALTLVALTPVDAPAEWYRGEGSVPELGGARVVSACLPQAQPVGGWRTVPPQGPLPLRSVLPAGSVLFCEDADLARVREVAASNEPLRVGGRQLWGFGAIALGAWPGGPGSPGVSPATSTASQSPAEVRK